MSTARPTGSSRSSDVRRAFADRLGARRLDQVPPRLLPQPGGARGAAGAGPGHPRPDRGGGRAGQDRPRAARRGRAQRQRDGRPGRRRRRTRSTPTRAAPAQALAAISATGRQALAEMRALLGVLRRGDDDSRPGGARAAARASASSTNCSTRPGPPACRCRARSRASRGRSPAGTALTAYRIIQESLTNTRKHAGPAATRERAAALYRRRAWSSPSPTTALGAARRLRRRGPRPDRHDRARRHVRRLRARPGPRPGGGFEVTARLPIASRSAGAAGAA